MYGTIKKNASTGQKSSKSYTWFSADQQKSCYTGYILKLFSLNCGPLAGISVHCKKLASDSFQTKPVDNLSDTDINDITNQANPDCSSEEKWAK